MGGGSLIYELDETEARDNRDLGIDALNTDEDFLTRERAALGDDAALFAGPGDTVASSTIVEDGEEDLLGGGESYNGHAGREEVTEFESSFPSIDTRNEVCYEPAHLFKDHG